MNYIPMTIVQHLPSLTALVANFSIVCSAFMAATSTPPSCLPSTEDATGYYRFVHIYSFLSEYSTNGSKQLTEVYQIVPNMGFATLLLLI